MKTRRKTTKTFTSLPYLLAPSHLFNRARLGGRPHRSTLTFEGGVGPPARVLYQKFNLRRLFHSTPDLENEPSEMAQILHAAPF